MVYEVMCGNARHCTWCDARLVFSQNILCGWSQHHCTAMSEPWVMKVLFHMSCSHVMFTWEKRSLASYQVQCYALPHIICAHMLQNRHFAARLHQSSTLTARQQQDVPLSGSESSASSCDAWHLQYRVCICARQLSVVYVGLDVSTCRSWSSYSDTCN